MNVTKRFLQYVKFDTTANEESSNCPSSNGQLEFAKFLVEELKSIGVKEVKLDEHGYVYASIPSNIERDIPTVGFIAHMDTSPAVSGKDVKPKIVKFTGEDIILNEEEKVILSSTEFPDLKKYIDKEIIVTDGTTLLGADDKAGVAEIISAVEYLIKNNIEHGTIKIAFTPDEEIGRGTDHFDVAYFNADFAYTMDGGEIGELQYENFNAASCKFTVHGKSVHPGDAKDKMINAALIASEIVSKFPKDETPENTSGYEGFYHLFNIQGTEEKAYIDYIIRDFDKEKFAYKKRFAENIANEINKRFSKPIVEVTIKDQYYNMKEKFVDSMYVIDLVKNAMSELNIEPIIRPIRGGTDGANLSFKGLLTPNIFAGGHNFHGKYEYIPIESMEKATLLIIKIIEILSKMKG